MAIRKPLVETTVLVLHQENPYVFTDAVGEDGTVTRDGSNVRYQILHGDTVEGKTTLTEGEEPVGVVIPYHAVVMATVTTTTSDPIEEPEDNFCVEA